jgi:hypothetical protein
MHSCQTPHALLLLLLLLLAAVDAQDGELPRADSSSSHLQGTAGHSKRRAAVAGRNMIRQYATDTYDADDLQLLQPIARSSSGSGSSKAGGAAAKQRVTGHHVAAARAVGAAAEGGLGFGSGGGFGEGKSDDSSWKDEGAEDSDDSAGGCY